MRKILSLIAMLCLCGAFANAHKYSIAVNNAAQYAYSMIQKADSTVGDETDSLDIKKSRIVEELTVKKDSTEKDVVKTFIDTAIADINNATDTTTLDSISQLILAKVDGCLNVEAKENATLTLDETEQNRVSKSYTDIINAPNLERVKALTSDAIGVIDLRESKNEKIATIVAGVAKVPKNMATRSDAEKIAKYTDAINKATKDADVDNAYEEAMSLVAAMAARKSAINAIKSATRGLPLSKEDENVLNGIIQDIMNSDNVASITLSLTIALAYLSDDSGQGGAIAAIRGAMQGDTSNPYFNKLVENEMKEISSTDDQKKIDELKNAAVNKLNIAVPAYREGRSNAVGTLGNYQKGPAIEVTDQNGNVFKFYNPKNAKLTEEK